MIPLKVTVPGSQLKVSSMFPFSSKSLLRYLINTHAIPDLKLCSYRRDREQRFFFFKVVFPENNLFLLYCSTVERFYRI